MTYRRVMKQGGRCDAEQGEICCGTGRFRGMAQVWSGEELWRIGGYNCPQVRGDTPQRSRWEAPVSAESTGGCSAVSARGGAR